MEIKYDELRNVIQASWGPDPEEIKEIIVIFKTMAAGFAEMGETKLAAHIGGIARQIEELQSRCKNA